MNSPFISAEKTGEAVEGGSGARNTDREIGTFSFVHMGGRVLWVEHSATELRSRKVSFPPSRFDRFGSSGSHVRPRDRSGATKEQS